MSKQKTVINYERMEVEDGGILYDINDLARLARIYENLCTGEYLYENQTEKKPLTYEQAYDIASAIRDEVADICECESEMINLYFNQFYADIVGSNGFEDEDE